MVVIIGFFILASVLIAGAGVCKAVSDTCNFRYHRSIFLRFNNNYFWDNSISSKNKYKNHDPSQGAKFWGATTFFVWTTDALHLFRTIDIIIYTTGLMLNCYVCLTLSQYYALNVTWLAPLFGLYGIWLRSGFFELFWSKVFVREIKVENI